MPRPTPSNLHNVLSSVILPLFSVFLLPVSFAAIALCVIQDRLRGLLANEQSDQTPRPDRRRCVIVSGGRMSKGLTLARAFKRAGWVVIGVEEAGWGGLCPMRFSAAVDHFYILPPASTSYKRYSAKLLSIAQDHSADLFIPISGVGSSVEDAQAGEEMTRATDGKCRTFIQDPETMADLHDKDRFMTLVKRLGMKSPRNQMVTSVNEAMDFLGRGADVREPKYVLKCMGLDENRGDMTLFPLKGDDEGMSRTRRHLERLKLGISTDCPYVFQEFIPGQEWCTHASVIDGRITSFVTCPSNDMLLTYEDATSYNVGQQAEKWTKSLLDMLQHDPIPTGAQRRLTGHFSFDLIQSTKDGQLYPIECNARAHTAIILLPLSRIAQCYSIDRDDKDVLRPLLGTAPRSWIYNDLIMRYLPLVIPSRHLLSLLHPSLPACLLDSPRRRNVKPNEDPLAWRLDPTLVADDWMPFLIFWHVYWPALLMTGWWKGKKWTRLNVSTGRIFEA